MMFNIRFVAILLTVGFLLSIGYGVSMDEKEPVLKTTLGLTSEQVSSPISSNVVDVNVSGDVQNTKLSQLPIQGDSVSMDESVPVAKEPVQNTIQGLTSKPVSSPISSILVDANMPQEVQNTTLSLSLTPGDDESTDEKEQAARKPVQNAAPGLTSELVSSPGSANLVDINVSGEDQKPIVSQTPTPGNWITYSGQLLFTNTFERPAVIIDQDDNRHVFVTDQYMNLYDNKNGVWYNLGGPVVCSPSAVLDTYGKIYVFVQGYNDRHLWVKYLDPTTMSSSWIDLGGSIINSPSACIQPNYPGWAAVYVKSRTDNNLWIRDVELSSTGPNGGGWTNTGGQIWGTPSAVPAADGTANIYTFVRGYADNNLWVEKSSALFTPPQHQGWTGLGGPINGDPKGIADPGWNNYIEVFVQDQTSGYNLWLNNVYINPSTGSISGAWYSKSGPLSSASYPSLTVDGSTSSANIHTLARAPDNSLWDCVTPASNVNAAPQWYKLGDLCKSDAGAIWFNGQLRANVVGNDNGLWRYRSTS